MANFAFVDSQNINLGVQAIGWKLDWRRFRVYLRDKYAVSTAYLFIGFIPENPASLHRPTAVRVRTSSSSRSSKQRPERPKAMLMPTSS